MSCVLPGFTVSLQHDAHEMNNYIINEIAHNLLDDLKISYLKTCVSCGKHTIRDTNEGHSLILNLQSDFHNVSVQTLIDSSIFITEDVECPGCGKHTPHKLSKVIKAFPGTLIIVLGRYTSNGSLNTVDKLHTPVHVNHSISFSETASKSILYDFKSAVCHLGENTRSGHYVSIIKSGNRFICCNDLSITHCSEDDMLETAYLIIYDKRNVALPSFVKPFTTCLLQTETSN